MTILYLYLNLWPFTQEKNLDYLYRVISFIIHKFDYYYLLWGKKKIALQIYQSTNKYLYSNSNNFKLELLDNESISKLLTQTHHPLIYIVAVVT